LLVSLKWLKDYVDLSGISAEEVVDKLTYCGLEVDEVIDQGKNLQGFVVGYVKEHKKHPNADKLSCCVVFDGEKDNQVVCGAPNVAAGQKIIFAPVNTYVPGMDFTLKKTKIRGEVSEGMICSEKELNISDNHEGIAVLDPELKEGTPVAEVFNKNDVLIEIAITPDRADALSHFGIARELAALFDRPLKKPEINISAGSKNINELASVVIENAEDCPRYSAKVVTGVQIKESPEWLKEKLRSIDLRPINNIVDITNFVLHEVGQPLHAFDLDMVKGNKIIIKSAGEDQKFITLDSKERNIKAEDLFICDAEKPVALAGVMGGENSEVTENTTNILIESAYFRPSRVRRTSKLLGLSTDASYRFERGCDPFGTVYAAERAAQLMAELGGGEVAEGTIDVYPNEIKSLEVELRFSRIEKILGYVVPKEQVSIILNKLGLTVISENEEVFLVNVPPFRPDIEREIDLIEEVARIYGYDRIPEISKINVTLEPRVDQSEFVENAKQALLALGFNEIVTNSLMTDTIADKFGKSVSILNPQSSTMSHLRTSLLPGALMSVAKNINVKEKDLLMFEVGKVFNRLTDNEINNFDDFIETEELSLIITGNRTTDEWYSNESVYDIYDLKGFVTEFLRKLNITALNESSDISGDLYDFGFAKTFKKKVIAQGGKLKTKLLKEFDIAQDVYVFTFNITELKEIRAKERRFSELLKYPKVVRDAAFILDKNVLNSDIELVIRKACSKLLKNIKLFDIFESDSLGKGKKSMAYQLEFFHEERTLTEEEVDKEFWTAIEKVKEKFNAQLRGK
jgi:phenylalanyl-tRNA synthetase beta chain